MTASYSPKNLSHYHHSFDYWNETIGLLVGHEPLESTLSARQKVWLFARNGSSIFRKCVLDVTTPVRSIGPDWPDGRGSLAPISGREGKGRVMGL